MAKRASPKAYEEGKERVNVSLTPTAVQQLDSKAAQLNVSRSELVERFARGLIAADPNQQFLGEPSRC